MCDKIFYNKLPLLKNIFEKVQLLRENIYYKSINCFYTFFIAVNFIYTFRKINLKYNSYWHFLTFL